MQTTPLETESNDALITSEQSPPQSARATSRRRLAVTRVQILILVGTLIFAVSHFFLWWELRLNAPQFPGGLFIQATSYEIQDSPKTPFDDIDQVDGLNHYIGMMSLGDAAKFEMSIAIPAIVIFIAMGIAAAFWRNRRAPLLTIPIVLYPLIYFVDLTYWLWYAGHHLDDMAAITIDPFTPRVFGTGVIAQFSTDAIFREGWYLAIVAGILCIIAIVLSAKRGKHA